ncbi:hypothetical protein ACF1GT_00695 [Streptomyces sp. NPDC014636]|uniref:hypothetical protein n=1 Tax=Streptomyces sp. NPDC014636 TaxID=3364876 RepID=UPI0036FD777A
MPRSVAGQLLGRRAGDAVIRTDPAVVQALVIEGCRADDVSGRLKTTGDTKAHQRLLDAIAGN